MEKADFEKITKLLKALQEAVDGKDILSINIYPKTYGRESTIHVSGENTPFLEFGEESKDERAVFCKCEFDGIKVRKVKLLKEQGDGK